MSQLTFYERVISANQRGATANTIARDLSPPQCMVVSAKRSNATKTKAPTINSQIENRPFGRTCGKQRHQTQSMGTGGIG